MNKALIVATCLLLIAGGMCLEYQRNRIETLTAEYNALRNQLVEAQKRTEQAQQKLEESRRALTALQQRNTQRTAEVIRNATQSGLAMSDSDTLNAYNNLIRRARQRNAERGGDNRTN